MAAASAIAAVVGLISPEGNSQRAVKFIISVFTVVMFVSPLKNIDFSVPEYTDGIDSFIDSHELENEVESQVADSLRSQIESSLSAYLEGQGITDYKTQVDINIDEDKNISIELIEISVGSAYAEYSYALREYVLNNFNVEPRILVNGEEV